VERVGLSDSWVDPVIALRAIVDLNADWYGTLYLDAGGSGGSKTAQASLGLGYRMGETWSLQGSWRYMDVEQEIAGQRVELDMSGLVLGVSYRF
jgi:hypothetical protein